MIVTHSPDATFSPATPGAIGAMLASFREGLNNSSTFGENRSSLQG